MTTKQVIVKLDLNIASHEIPLFRGAINEMLEKDSSVLFHNHQRDGKYRYAYPLVQYKRIHGKAAMVCIGDGTEAIYQFFDKQSLRFRVGSREADCITEEVLATRPRIEIGELHSYAIKQWIPFNAENYKKFKDTESMVEQIQILEHILIGNILSFAKGIGMRFDDVLTVKITDMESVSATTFKGVKLMSFNLSFSTNVSLPNYIGLGKGVSHGMGTIYSITDKKSRNE